MAEEQTRLERNKYIIVSPRSWNGIAWSPKKSVEMAPESHDTIFSSTASSSRRTQWIQIFSGKLCLFISIQHLWCCNEAFLQFSYYSIVNRCTTLGKIGKTSVLPLDLVAAIEAQNLLLHMAIVDPSPFLLAVFCYRLLANVNEIWRLPPPNWGYPKWMAPYYSWSSLTKIDGAPFQSFRSMYSCWKTDDQLLFCNLGNLLVLNDFKWECFLESTLFWQGSKIVTIFFFVRG